MAEDDGVGEATAMGEVAETRLRDPVGAWGVSSR
jgi:hypothetical protein